MMILTNVNNHQQVSPADVALMTRLADDLIAGGVDMFIAHEKEWRASPLAAFMRGKPSAASQQMIFTKTIWAKRHNRNRR